MYVFKDGLKGRWGALAAAVAGLTSIHVGDLEVDGVAYKDLEFVGYGGIPGIPVDCLVEVDDPIVEEQTPKPVEVDYYYYEAVDQVTTLDPEQASAEEIAEEQAAQVQE